MCVLFRYYSQNAYYEGYTGNVDVTNLLLYKFFDELILVAVKYSGSWHDIKLASQYGLLHPKLSDELTPPGYATLEDRSFVVDCIVVGGKFARARKGNKTAFIPESVALAAVDIFLQRFLPRERQSAEWGVRALKAPFGRLRLPLSPDMKIKWFSCVCTQLINERTRIVGQNHITTIYENSVTDINPWVQRFLEEQNLIPFQ